MGQGRRAVTLVEMLVVLALVLVAWGVFLEVSVGVVQDYDNLSGRHLVARWGQQIINDIRDDTLASRKYFEDDARGTGYLDVMEMDAESPPLTSLRLPVIAENDSFGPDEPGNEKTGSALFFAKAQSPLVVTVPYQGIEDRTFRVSVYRFVLYYLAARPNQRIGRFRGTLDLMRWASIPVADYDQVIAIQDPDPGDGIDPRSEVVAAFVNEYGSTWLWDASRDATEAFYPCDQFGYVSPVPLGSVELPRDGTAGLRSAIPTAATTNKHASVCWNAGHGGFEVGLAVPRFAVADTTGDGFPHGFEVQIVGPSGARELLLRLAIAKGTTRGIAAREFTAVLTTRDF